MCVFVCVYILVYLFWNGVILDTSISPNETVQEKLWKGWVLRGCLPYLLSLGIVHFLAHEIWLSPASYCVGCGAELEHLSEMKCSKCRQPI